MGKNKNQNSTVAISEIVESEANLALLNGFDPADQIESEAETIEMPEAEKEIEELKKENTQIEERRILLSKKLNELKALYESKADTSAKYKEKVFVQFINQANEYWYIRYSSLEKAGKEISIRLNEKKTGLDKLSPVQAFERFQKELDIAMDINPAKKMGGGLANF